MPNGRVASDTDHVSGSGYATEGQITRVAGESEIALESFAGDPVAADSAAMQSMLDASLTSWLEHLKAAAESRA